MLRQFLLANKIRVVFDPTDGPLIGVAVGIDSGSRDDVRGVPLRHGFEHTIFRANRAHPTWAEYTRYIDGIAYRVSPETDKTGIVVSAGTDRAGLRSLLCLLSQTLANPLITKEHVATEVTRLHEEHGDDQDRPQDLGERLFDRMMFPEHGFGPPVDGERRGIDQLSAERYRQLQHELLVGHRIIIAVTGGFDPAVTRAHIERYFATLPSGKPRPSDTFDYHQCRSALEIRVQPTQQSSIFLGFPTFGLAHPDRIALGVLRNHLSARNSSPISIFLDGEGRGYGSEDHLWHWDVAGQYTFTFSMSREKLLESLAVVTRELSRVRHELLTDEDIRIAQRNLRFHALEGLSQYRSMAAFHVYQIIHAGRATSTGQYLRRLRTVTSRDIRRAANEILVQKRMVCVVTGPLQGLRKSDLYAALRIPRHPISAPRSFTRRSA